MIADLKPYPAYKESGVPWLGQVPEHWNVQRLRNLADMRVSNVDKHTKEGEQPVRLCNYVDVYKNHYIRPSMGLMQATATQDEVERFRLAVGDVLITKDSETWNDIGVPALVRETAADLVSGYHLALLRPFEQRLSGEYLLRALQHTGAQYQFHVEANGVTRYGLSHAAIRSVWLPAPPLPDQSAIVRFLGHADAKIRRYIRAKQRLVKLLEEQRQAIIHRAVTRGLDPNVRLKPSGVPWLSDVPEHWEVRKLRQIGSFRGGMTPSMEATRYWGGTIPWVTPKDMKRTAIGDSIMKVTDAALSETSLRLIHPPAVLLVVRGMILARKVPFAWTTAAVTINQDMKALQPVAGVNAQFLTHRLDSAQAALAPLIDEAGHGTRRLPTERLRDLHVALPPEGEQRLILRYLGEAIPAIDTAIGRANSEISLLREYRTRLIADVVTGKLDVREAARGLPEEPVSAQDAEEAEEQEEEPAGVDDAGANPDEDRA